MPQKYIVRGQKVTHEKILRAKEMRSNMTEAETILWQNLRANYLGGWHFRRQQIILGYIVDFYCHAASLIIEIDGDIHEGQAAVDRERDRTLEEKGFFVLRFRNHEIEQHLNDVLSRILAACNQTLTDRLNSPPLRGEGLGERSKGA